MARPERNNVDYFPFYCDDGNKMFYLEETYGNDGFATFVKILKELAKTNYHYLDLSKSSTLMFLSAKCKVTKETLKAIINDLAELGKFDPILWNENQIIWCQDFIDSIQDAYTRRNNNCMTYERLLQHLQSLGVRKPNKEPLKGNNKPQSKEKDNKENKSKKNIPSLSEFLTYGLEKEKLLCEKGLKLKYDAWVENGWKDGNQKKIVNWKSKLLNTIQYLPKKTSIMPDAFKNNAF